MIDVTQLTSLVSAFRVETEKERQAGTARGGEHLQRHCQEQGRHRSHRHPGHGNDGAIAVAQARPRE